MLNTLSAAEDQEVAQGHSSHNVREDLHYRMEPKEIKKHVSETLRLQIGKKRKPQPKAQ